ncbi:hypothetical protein E2C01_041346 [Portunus trituberculatus]|uniref:RNase H type-1 domain-containing protein n=1 Tax=Portunus trituberculatus TaxID=210409 RepID=A0A5B7FQ68_PORTR|nr:hypothetical protein [Portunus trituberculatus]
MWVGKQLSFMAHVSYLRERTQARLNVMWAMTRLMVGATYSVLHLYYMQAVPSLVDYSVPIFTLSPIPAKATGGAAENHLRTMLGAARVLQHDAEGVSQRKLQLVMMQGSKVLHNPWLLWSALETHHLTHTGNRPKPQLDLPASMYRIPAMGASCSALHRHSSDHQQVPLHHHGAAATHPNGYGEGYQARSGRTGAAAITGSTKLCVRTPDHCSTLQTELLAIQLALEHAQHYQEATMVLLHTDSRAGLQVLQQPQPSDNVGLVTTILGSLQSLSMQG